MVTSKLRYFLASNLGQLLTPELAASIENMAQPVGSPINLSQFQPEHFDGNVIAVEKLSDILDEMHILHELHWLETEKHRLGLRMNPDYQLFQNLEAAGRLLQFTLRNESGELIGNLRMNIGQSSHTQTLYASEDTLFIKPENRGGFLAMRLLKYAEKALHQLGIREIRANSKLVNNAGVLMRRMKYTPVATEFVKFLED